MIWFLFIFVKELSNIFIYYWFGVFSCRTCLAVCTTAFTPHLFCV